MSADDSGVETVTAQGDWKPSRGAAEQDCHDKLDARILAKTAELEREGKEVTQNQTFPLEEEQRTVSGRVQYRYRGRAELVWKYSDENR